MVLFLWASNWLFHCLLILVQLELPIVHPFLTAPSLYPRPRVPEWHCAVEHWCIRRRVSVLGEVADALELEDFAHLGV